MGNRPKELTLTHTTKPPYAFDRRAAVATNFDVAVGMKIMAAAGGIGGWKGGLELSPQSSPPPPLRSRKYRHEIEGGS